MSTDFLDEEIDLNSRGLAELPAEYNGFDPRLKLMSYSSNLLLHKCPRKYQLYKLKAVEDPEDPDAALNQNLTFAFGHIVGEGIQDVLDGMEESAVIWRMFLGFHANLEDRNEKQNKSFYLAVTAIQRFISLRANGFLDDYELLYYQGKPAKELSFRIHLPNGFKYRGSVDAVLRHKVSGKILVLECKTSSSNTLHATTYKNSSQAVGYSVVLDVIAPEVSSYEVLYLVYLTKDMAYEQLRFVKTYLQRATWIQELLLDVETIKLYEQTGIYPMRGESCMDFFRDCEYLNQCNLSTHLITAPFTPKSVIDDKVYDVELTLDQIIESQMKKVIPIMPIAGEAIPQDGDTML
jgi:hypothetical protein